jgi:hypothetical protein
MRINYKGLDLPDEPISARYLAPFESTLRKTTLSKSLGGTMMGMRFSSLSILFFYCSSNEF